MEELKNGTKKLDINKIDGCDIYCVSELNGKKYVELKGWFYVNGDGWHFNRISVDEMLVEEFLEHKAHNSFGYDDSIVHKIDDSKQCIDDFAFEDDAIECLEELGLTVLFLEDLNEYVPGGMYISPIKEKYNVEETNAFAAMEVKVPGGKLRATAATDPMYPGVDVEFIAETENRGSGKFLSRPRVLMEYKIEDNELRAAIWADESSEDYSDDVDFNKHYYKV